MTGPRDIERTLDAWFVDGQSVMPDRLFEAVLDQVERTPQRPFARLRRRLTEMTPRIRILMAAAAALIVAVVGFALIGRPQPDGVGASPSASALSTPIVSPSPALFERQSRQFDPFVGPGETPSPRAGALTFSTPAGWGNPEDFPNGFQISPRGAGEADGIWLWSDVVVVSEADPCSETPEPSVGESARDIADWLAEATGVVASTPIAVSIGGLEGWRVDISMDPAWTEVCPFSDGQPVRGLFTDRPPEGGFHWTIGGDARMRAYLLDVGNGRALLVDIEASTKASYVAFVDDATAVVESFEFTR
jgi:hypothetical protein